MNPDIISKGLKPDILKLLHQGKFDEVLTKITPKPNKRKGFLSFIKQSKIKNEELFAYSILQYCLLDELNPDEYTGLVNLNFSDDFLPDLIELFRILLVLQDYAKASEKENIIALTLLKCIENGVVYIEENSNNYPQNPINGKTWIDGAGLRVRVEELAGYFLDKNDDKNALQAIFLKAKLTNSIMNHYPNLVGPDMIAVGHQLEKIGNFEKAKLFYKPVVLDFTEFVQDIQENLDDPDIGVSHEDLPITQSLINALEGLKRLGNEIDEQLLTNARHVLSQLEKADITTE